MKNLIVIFCALALPSCNKIEQRVADSLVAKKYGEIVLHKWKIQTAGTTYDQVTFHIVKEGDQDAKVFEGQTQIGFWGGDGDDPSDLSRIRIIITTSTVSDIFGQSAWVLTADQGDPNNSGALTFSGTVFNEFNFISGSGLEASYANSSYAGPFVATAYPNRISW